MPGDTKKNAEKKQDLHDNYNMVTTNRYYGEKKEQIQLVQMNLKEKIVNKNIIVINLKYGQQSRL